MFEPTERTAEALDFKLWEQEVSNEPYQNPELAETRILADLAHLQDHMDERGDVPDYVFAAVIQNKETASYEIGMPYAVSTTEHQVEFRQSVEGRRERVILWLGKTALQVAASGYRYHFSAAAHQRVAVEEAEARYAQETLRPGVAQVLISPKMTAHDAPMHLAKAEHLHADDSIRVSTAITNKQGEVIGRRLQSLLVRDVPFEAWIALLQDENNVFGKRFELRNAVSAISVMELFNQMDLPESALPNGPVTLVEAVVPYIRDERARSSVERQIVRFKGDQAMYAREAKQAAIEWAQFDLELARSLQKRTATDTIRHFIMQNQWEWSDESLSIINGHSLGDTQYAMTTELAAILARAKQKLVGDELSVVTGNDKAIADVSMEDRRRIIDMHETLVVARIAGADPEYIRRLERRQYELLHRQPIRSGGGCLGESESTFNPNGPNDIVGDGVGESRDPFRPASENKANWKWKQGVCQVKVCPSPKPTEVGPCSVCRRCQAEFDAGRDPTKGLSTFAPQSKQSDIGGIPSWREVFGVKPKPIKPLKVRLGERAMAGPSI